MDTRSITIALCVGIALGLLWRSGAGRRYLSLISQGLSRVVIFGAVLWLSGVFLQALPAVNVARGVPIANGSNPYFLALPTLLGLNPFQRQGGSVPLSQEALKASVANDRQGVVKIIGYACSEITVGSGFVVAPDVIATNAHVVASSSVLSVEEAGGGTRQGTVIYFGPETDLALVRTRSLPAQPLDLANREAPSNSAAAVLGYPGGGDYQVAGATVLHPILAVSSDIYDQGRVIRRVYEIRSHVVPGNSGGPLVDRNGRVIGIVFGKSTDKDDSGYALTVPQVWNAIQQSKAKTAAADTGECIAG